MDFRIRSLLAFALGHLALSVFAVVLPSVLCVIWSDLDSQFRCGQQSAGWNFQPHSFDAQKDCSLDWPRAYRKFGDCLPPHQPGGWVKAYSWFHAVFDATLGFPGEGPSSSNTSIVSANIGSVMTDKTWKTWNADVVCLQETRVGRNNFRSAAKIFQNVGFTPCFGDLLPGLWYNSKTTKTPCGGTLIAGGSAIIQPFDRTQDSTGLFDSLFKTKRVAAAWIQVTPRKKALVISVYATTSASQDTSVHSANDKLFGDIFAFAAQFGHIPIILAGDLQAPPMSYPTISNVVSFQSWHDPLVKMQENGELFRPLTFSNDGTFAGVGDGCTSIDSVLVNDIAFAALVKADVLETFGKQHRPIKLEFDWPTITQVGYHVLKAAPFVLDNCVDGDALDWETNGKQEFDASTDSNVKWDVVNSFLQKALIAKGAVWGEGLRCRGSAPVFVAKSIAPKQLSNHCAANRHSNQLSRLVGRLSELFVRLSRDAGTAQDLFVTQRTADKVARQLHAFSAPVPWPTHGLPSLVDVHFAKTWADMALKTYDLQLRTKRIKAWKNRIKNSASHGCTYIFHHLKNKQLDEPTNLVVDDSQNIIFQPNQALEFLNSEWDQIYSANTLCHHPLKMLETVWPYIHDKQKEAFVPPICGQDLFRIIQKRKACAAPGLDGWRTAELQRLSPSDLQPCADFFHHIEDSSLPLPQTLVCAKQVILNKPGPATALNKRLITILPALLLAYTGARFAQLQSWQQDVMPSSILGGIKGRFMSDLDNQLRIDIDDAKAHGHTLVGLKLDKAKAFDRVVPTFVAALFLAFGIPKGIANFFVKIYDGLHRHLSYRNWCSPNATTAPNGVCQGCSLSLLAMNMYTKVWCHLLEHFPEISARAYIDDSYLWCRLQHSALLSKAVELTKVWDLLSGQKLNEGKSSAWGTTTEARKVLKSTFPEVPIVLELAVPGTVIYTSERSSFCFSEARLKKILDDTDNIAALPVGKAVRGFLIGAKIVPQMSFGAHISKIPQLSLKKIQNAVAKALWVGQPMWRSKQLLHVILSKPHRTDPVTAGAYSTVIEVVRLCHNSPDAISQLLNTWNQPSGNHSLAESLKAAFEFLGIDYDSDINISFMRSTPVSIFDLSPKCISKSLQNIARHACYCSIDPKSRKDFRKPCGIFDFQQSTRLLFSRNPRFQLGSDQILRLENVLVGCTLTNDRLAASGWVTSASCRFCAQEKECLAHLLRCPKVHELLGEPVIHDFGNNFAMLGHFLHPNFVAKRRLQCSSIESINLASSFSTHHQERLWTDGSVLYAENFWITNATFAILDESQTIRHKGVVQHWSLSSYAAELWAVLIACAQASFPTMIYCDCLTVVDQAQCIFAGNPPHNTWSHRRWWTFLHHIVCRRKEVCEEPFRIAWIPAHCFEGIPIELISEDLAALKGTTIEHIRHNRLVDAAAKEIAHRTASVHPETQKHVQNAIFQHQRWLIALHALLPTEQPDRATTPPTQHDEPHCSLEECRKRFPSWPWHTLPAMYSWKPKIPAGLQCASKWPGPEDDWHACVNFLCTLRWHVSEYQSYSFNELAVAFHCSGFKLIKDPDLVTFLDIYRAIRGVLQILSKDDSVDAHPGVFHTTKPRACGRILPQGCILGAIPLVSDQVRMCVASLFSLGAGRTLASWEISVHSC